jgi:hypothetical protein
MKSILHLSTRVAGVSSLFCLLLVLQVHSQQGPPIVQDLCGQLEETTWDCDDMGEFYRSSDPCDYKICDADDPVCATWFGREGGGSVFVGPDGLWSQADVDFPPGIGSELEAEWKSCGSVIMCASECVATPFFGFVCQKNEWMPTIPMGGFHYTIKGDCPPPPGGPGVQIANL